MIAFDTNILVYAFDTYETGKREVCGELYLKVMRGDMPGVVTNQILAELASVLIHKIKNPLHRREMQDIIGGIHASPNWTKFNYTSDTVVGALESPLPIWDALITRTLLENNVTKIYTENVKHFRGSGIKAINPLS